MLAEAPRNNRCYIPKEILDYIRIVGDWREDIWRIFSKENCVLTSPQSKRLGSLDMSREKGHKWDSSDSLIYVPG